MVGSLRASIKKYLGVLSLSVLSISGVSAANADDYPSKPIEMIVGYLPGGATDFAARVLAEALTPRLGQSVIVVNRPGATSTIAADAVKRADPDGYTLWFGNIDAVSILPAVKPDVPYQIPDSLTFISKAANFPLAFGVNAKLPMNTMQEFVEYAKANPGKFNYGSSGVGGALHIEGVRLAGVAGIDITHVPYKGSSGAAADVAGGSIDGMFGTVKDLESFVAGGTIKLIGVTSPERVPAVPDVPTFAEAGLGDASFVGWFGLMGPANLPKDVTDKLIAAVTDSLAQKDVQDRLAGSGLYVSVLTGDEFKDYVVKQYGEFKDLAAKENIKITD